MSSVIPMASERRPTQLAAGSNFPAFDFAGRLWKAIAWGTWVYLVGVLVFWFLLVMVGERSWLGTILLYGPRWMGLLPLAVLVPTALFRRRLYVLQMAALVVMLVPVMGLCLPWRSVLAKQSHGPLLRVLTCNCDGSHLNSQALGEVIAFHMPDIVALQEWFPEHEKTVFWQQEWNIQTTNQGLCLASRFPIRQVESLGLEELKGQGGVLRSDLETSLGMLHYFNLHLATPREGLQAILDGESDGIALLKANTVLRRQESVIATEWINQVVGRTLISGDFNMPVDSTIYRNYWAPWTNAFSTAGWGWGHSKHTRLIGVRIDHLLAGPGWRCRRCWVGPDVGSDHRPVIADWDWVGFDDETGESR